jgi:hypothetical protein
MKKLKLTASLKGFEKLSESHEKTLVGGFSQSISTVGPTTIIDDSGTTNNCQGGNCTRDCGHGQNIQCNTKAGCGE